MNALSDDAGRMIERAVQQVEQGEGPRRISVSVGFTFRGVPYPAGDYDVRMVSRLGAPAVVRVDRVR